MDHLSSMYIDNELNLDEKIQFVDKIQADRQFYQNTHDLLLQEKELRVQPDTSGLPERPPVRTLKFGWFKKVLQPIIYATAGFAAAGLIMFSPVKTPSPPQYLKRFVVYYPYANSLELSGSFTQWQPTPLKPIGSSGYWELNLQVPTGEHRFVYIVNGTENIVDPTIAAREKDDFGGENSILNGEDSV